MHIVISSLIFPIILGILAYILQMNSWKQQNKAKIIESRREKAIEVTSEISRLIDRRMTFQRRFCWALMDKARGNKVDDSRLKSALSNYNDAIIEWAVNYTKVKSLLSVYFGENIMKEFEYNIHKEFQRIGGILEIIYKNDASIQDISIIDNKLNHHGRRCFLFVNSLSERIRKNNLTGTGVYEAMYEEELRNISYIYLVRRLLGVLH